jgi:hypothetical protein
MCHSKHSLNKNITEELSIAASPVNIVTSNQATITKLGKDKNSKTAK